MAYSGQGQGTSTDPYQVTTLYQLLEVFKIYNASAVVQPQVYCKLMNDIDFNDYQEYWSVPNELFYANNTSTDTYKRTKFIYIDGNGYGLYNMYCYNNTSVFKCFSTTSSYHNDIIIKNIIIEAIYIMSISNSGSDGADKHRFCSSESYYSSAVHFINSDIRLKLYAYTTPNQYSTMFYMSYFTNCIINIDIICNNTVYINNSSGYDYGYGYDIIQQSSTSSGNDTDYSNYYNEWNIRILGIMEQSAGTNYYLSLLASDHKFSSFFIEMVGIKSNIGNIRISGGSYFSNCYFVVKNNNSTYTGTMKFDYFVTGINFYDKDIADNHIVDTHSGSGSLLALTTAQCKNAEYLEQQGFIIAR